MLRIYLAPGTIGLATLIALKEAGADVEVVRVDFRAQQQQSAEYLAVNPKGRVPSLVTDRGIMTETPALLAYVAQTYPAKPIRLIVGSPAGGGGDAFGVELVGDRLQRGATGAPLYQQFRSPARRRCWRRPARRCAAHAWAAVVRDRAVTDHAPPVGAPARAAHDRRRRLAICPDRKPQS